MLEKALISGVTHKTAETVYRVEGVSAARLFDALAEAGVNVDTVIQTGSEIVFSADEGPEAVERESRRTGCSPPSSSRASSTRPCVRIVWKPKSERKSRGKTVRCTRKRCVC